MADRPALERLSKRLVQDGKLIEAGWIGLRIAAIPADAPPIQLKEMRTAFFAGAQHLLSSIMATLDPGAEPTLGDMERLSRIQDELDRFIADFAATSIPTKGNA